jgi:hypothetical protein
MTNGRFAKETKQTQYNNQQMLEPCCGCNYSDLRSRKEIRQYERLFNESIEKLLLHRTNSEGTVFYTSFSGILEDLLQDACDLGRGREIPSVWSCTATLMACCFLAYEDSQCGLTGLDSVVKTTLISYVVVVEKLKLCYSYQ